MLELTIPDMTCGHCMNVITRAVGELDRAARLNFDLPGHRVTVTSGKDAADIRAAIENAGYTVSDVQSERGEASCCGSCHV